MIKKSKAVFNTDISTVGRITKNHCVCVISGPLKGEAVDRNETSEPQYFDAALKLCHISKVTRVDTNKSLKLRQLAVNHIVQVRTLWNTGK